jgi:hypothetical protein
LIETYLIPAVFTAVLVPFFAPLLMDLLACLWIALMNRARHKPTWKVGTRFKNVILANAASLGPCYITAKTWKFIILKEIGDNPGVIRIKKRDMLKTQPVELDTSILK